MDDDLVTVLIADDHTVAREGLRAMLEFADHVRVVGEAADGQEAVEKAKELHPRIVLMDLLMPGLDGLAATREIKAVCPQTAVVVMTGLDTPGALLDALRAGAAGYLLKDASRDLLVQTIHTAISGGTTIEDSVLRRAIESLDGRSALDRTPWPLPAGASRLTNREREILRLLAEGRTNGEIGEALVLAHVTVKKHVQSIITKLEVADRTQAAVTAIRCGLVP